jgi:hypothetical protein
LKTAVKEEAKRELRRKMGDAERGAAPENETSKLRYGNLRQALLDDYTRRGNKSLQTLADGTETIWGLSALDKFLTYSSKNQGSLVAPITVNKIREFVRKRQGEKTVQRGNQSFVGVASPHVQHRPNGRQNSVHAACAVIEGAACSQRLRRSCPV